MRAILKVIGAIMLFLSVLFAGIMLMYPSSGITYGICVILFIAGSVILLLGFTKELTGYHESVFGWISSGVEIVLFYACGFFGLVGIVRFFIKDFVSFIKPGLTGMYSILLAAGLGIIAYIVHETVPILEDSSEKE